MGAPAQQSHARTAEPCYFGGNAEPARDQGKHPFRASHGPADMAAIQYVLTT